MNLNEISEAMKELDGWSIGGNSIIKNITHDSFKKSLAFVNRVGEIAERMNHHPYILVKFNVVKLILLTHATSGLTKIDFDVAKEIDALS